MTTVNDLQSQVNSLLNQIEDLTKESKIKRKRILFSAIIFLVIVICQTYWPFLWLSSILINIDNYFRLIITSWPAVVLIIFTFLLFRHKDSIDYLLRNSNFKFGSAELNKAKQEQLGSSGIDIATGSIIPIENESNEDLRKEITRLSKAKIFERIYSIIFGSQINILNKLITNNGSLPIEQAIIIYNDTIFRNPYLKNYSFDSYLHFLKNISLIYFIEPITSARVIEITTQGKEFFNYIISEKLDLYKTS